MKKQPPKTQAAKEDVLPKKKRTTALGNFLGKLRTAVVDFKKDITKK